MNFASLDALNQVIVACEKCPRLVSYRAQVARERRRAYREEEYWGRPVPGWGDHKARVLLVGLAPAAHGGNRTGRVFTGDNSATFLFGALHRAGFANRTESRSREDGLAVTNLYIGASVRCAPPDNKPTRAEFENCRPYLVKEIRLLTNLCVIVALGRIALDNVLLALAARGISIPSPRPRFGHNRAYQLGPYTLISSYHPSHRNTATGLLTASMFDQVLERVKAELAQAAGAESNLWQDGQ